MQQKEILSAYMDGHIEESNFADTLANSPELQQKWANYHAIRSVMQGEEILLGSDFSAKMADLIENEEIEKQPQGIMLKLKRWGTPLMQAGIAASVCLVAVFGFNIVNSNNEVAQNEPVLQTLPFSSSVQAVSYNAPAQQQPTAERLENQQRLINSLLQNHELQRRINNNVTLSDEQKAKSQTSSNQAQPTQTQSK